MARGEPTAGCAVVMGLDLSLRATGAVALPRDWDGGFAGVVVMPPSGYSLPRHADEAAQLQRILTIAGAVVGFAKDHEVTHVAIEQHAFSQNLPSTRTRAELTGIVKLKLGAWGGIVLSSVVASQARKFALGRVPRVGAKQAVYARLKGLYASFTSHDTADAFVVANYARARLGLAAFRASEEAS